jgi:hypothetical protein
MSLIQKSGENCDGGGEAKYELLKDYLLMQPTLENNARGEQLWEFIVEQSS